ncbi:MAG: hypothetical protein PHY31_08655, partial [Smithellaceae bacterium]|nr:hypothetical protein [Smithellaceae bacterium]
EAAEAAIPLYAVARNHTTYQNSDGTHSIFKRVGDRKRLKVVNQNFPSREEAMKYMAQHAEEILNVKTTFGEEILPVPEIAVRKGVERRTADATPEMFMETFAPRGIEFGNWNNQAERQEVMNHAYDGLLDLADALGLPPKALMLNGELAIAFGARGQGLSGAKAHYERDYGVINLTKMKGAGSLAHEWMHALDHYLGRQDTKASREKVTNKRGDMVYKASPAPSHDYLSHGESFKSEAREELRETYRHLIESMYKKAEQYVEDTKKADQFLAKAREQLKEKLDDIRKDLARDLTNYHKSKGGYSSKPIKFLEPASSEQMTEFDRIADILLEGGDLDLKWTHSEKGKGRYSNDTVDLLNKIFKAVRNRSGFATGQYAGPLDKVAAAMRTYKERLRMFDDAQNKTEKTKKVPTSYAIEAKKMDQARSGDYWSEPHEMIARAFAAYVEDKITETGGQSDFLVYQAHGGILLPMIDGFVARPYPEGKEREAINKAFDTFIKEIKTRETPKGVEMYSVSERGAVRSGASFAEQLDDIAAGKITNRREPVTISETPQVLVGLGADQLPLVITHGTIEKTTTGKHGVSFETLKQLPRQLADPVMVFDSATEKGSLVVMTELRQDGKTIVAAIELSKESGHNIVNDIVSVHQRESEQHFINWINQGLLRYMNRSKSRAWSMASGLQLPRVSRSMPGFKNKILFDSDLVKENQQYGERYTFSPKHPAFYSQLAAVVEKKMGGKMPLDQLVKMLKGNGVTDAEIDNLLGNFETVGEDARGWSGTVTKQQVMDEIKANSVDFRDVVLGGPKEGVTIFKASDVENLPNEYSRYFYVAVNDATGEIEGGANQYSDLLPLAHFSQYTEPGAVPGSYREMFVTASDRGKPREISFPTEEEALAYADKHPEGNFRLTNNLPIYEDLPISIRSTIDEYYRGRITRQQVLSILKENGLEEIAGGRYKRIGEGKFTLVENKEWEDGHTAYSDIQNPIVRIRFNERDADGKRILFVEEIQGPSDANQQEMPEYLRKRIYDIGVKRVLALAKEQGFDGVAWTTGEMQAERYDLSKHVDEIDVIREDEETWGVVARKDGEEKISQGGIPTAKLDEFVGKDLARKILEANFAVGDADAYSGLDLKVGGEGLKSL